MVEETQQAAATSSALHDNPPSLTASVASPFAQHHHHLPRRLPIETEVGRDGGGGRRRRRMMNAIRERVEKMHGQHERRRQRIIDCEAKLWEKLERKFAKRGVLRGPRRHATLPEAAALDVNRNTSPSHVPPPSAANYGSISFVTVADCASPASPLLITSAASPTVSSSHHQNTMANVASALRS